MDYKVNYLIKLYYDSILKNKVAVIYYKDGRIKHLGCIVSDGMV